MANTIALRPETAELYEIVDYKGKDEVHVLGHGDIVFSKLTPDACAALLSRKFPYLKAKPEKAAAKTIQIDEVTLPKTDKAPKA